MKARGEAPPRHSQPYRSSSSPRLSSRPPASSTHLLIKKAPFIAHQLRGKRPLVGSFTDQLWRKAHRLERCYKPSPRTQIDYICFQIPGRKQTESVCFSQESESKNYQFERTLSVGGTTTAESPDSSLKSRLVQSCEFPDRQKPVK